MIILSACELRGSKHGHPLGRKPNPGAVGVATAPATAGGHRVSAGGHVVRTAGNVGNGGSATVG